MSYGKNMAWGLQATKTLGSATYNGQSNPYLIKSGYLNNIFRGDPVIIMTSGPNAGYIQSAYDTVAGDHVFNDKPTLGVFVGCSFITPTSINPIDPASPGRAYWPTGTVTLNAVPATAFVIDDPNVVYNVQTSLSPGLIQSNMGKNASYGIPEVADIVQGNTSTGKSLVTIDQGSLAPGQAATLNMKLIRFVPIAGNFAADAVIPNLGYNNAEVIIQNHVFCSRPAVV